MTNKIICPNCGEKIDIENLIKEGAKTTLDKELKLQKEKYEKQLKLLEQETLNLKKNSKTELEKAVVEAIEETLNNQKIEYKKKEEKLKQSIMDENKEALELLENELEDKTNKLKELNKLKAENSKIAREKQEL
ncbi:hypothetical protein IJ670_04970, partial [bacterium]|nr:hypothetical protein [bacterium]